MDEADEMTSEAQQLLKKVLDNTNSHNRFIFICNNFKNIITAIKSRCIIIHVPVITTVNNTLNIKQICKNENINIQSDAVTFIAKYTQGDIRKSINVI